MQYIATIGLEVHVQLKTRSKMFCGCPVEFGAEPNSHTCPICLGLPGALPVMNHEALRMTALTGLMLGCDIAPQSASSIAKIISIRTCRRTIRSRSTICRSAPTEACPCTISLIRRTHRKISRRRTRKCIWCASIWRRTWPTVSISRIITGIDFNRAGTPLMEIVTKPEINSPEEAFAFLTALKQILIYGGVSDADMEKGQFRCDCNVSVRPETQQELGAKIEIKNMNSISGVRRALTYEIARQIEALKAGRKLAAGNARLGRCARRDLSHAHEGIGPRLSIFSRSGSRSDKKRSARRGSARPRSGIAESETRALRRRIRGQSCTTQAFWQTISILRVILRRPRKAHANRRASRTGS